MYDLSDKAVAGPAGAATMIFSHSIIHMEEMHSCLLEHQEPSMQAIAGNAKIQYNMVAAVCHLQSSLAMANRSTKG